MRGCLEVGNGKPFDVQLFCVEETCQVANAGTVEGNVNILKAIELQRQEC